MLSTDLDGKSPSGAEIAELFKQEKTESPAKHTAENPFFFSGNSVSIQTVIGADGVSVLVLVAKLIEYVLDHLIQ